jgi:hypothetical protein
MKHEALRRGALRVDVVVRSVELFLSHSWKLDADANRHGRTPLVVDELRPYAESGGSDRGTQLA